jgi:hypothetical protein
MPDDVQTLLRLGPFKGLDVRSATAYAEPTSALQCANADTHTREGALCNFYGRVNIATFGILGPNATIGALAEYDTAPSQTYYIARAAGSTTTAYYDPVNNSFGSLAVTSEWRNGVQMNGILWLDNGQQVFLTSGNQLAVAEWNYPVPDSTAQGYSVASITAPPQTTLTANYTVPSVGAIGMMTVADTSAFSVNDPVSVLEGSPFFVGQVQQVVSPTQMTVLTEQYDPATPTLSSGQGVTIPLAQATYTYAFVWAVQIPTASGTIVQLTSPQYGTPPYAVAVDGTSQDVVISGIFTGLTFDGYTYTTQVYRESSTLVVENPSTNVSATNNFYLLTTLTSNNSYIDHLPDTQITGNQQLILNNDVPPTGPVDGVYENLGNSSIESFQDRLCVLARVQNAGTNNLPQTQLWYSRPGLPWSFDGVFQVLLVGSENTTPVIDTSALPFYLPSYYGDQPSGLAKVGSYLMVFKTLSTWLITGTDETNFTALPQFADIGLIAPASLTKASGMVFWLSAQGAYSFDGANLVYLSRNIYNYFEQIGPGTMTKGVGFYGDLTWFLSFPSEDAANGPTFAYAIPTKEWTTVPYAVTAATFDPSAGNATAGYQSFKFNQIVGARYNSNAIDYWLSDRVQDLGVPAQVTWFGQIMDSGRPESQKDYQFIQIYAPKQNNIAVITLHIDTNEDVSITTDFANSPPPVVVTFDLSIGPSTKTQRIPQGSAKGYTGLVQINVSPKPGATPDGVEIWAVLVGGTIARPFQVLNSGGAT